MAHITATRALHNAGRSATPTLFARLQGALSVWRQRRALSSLPAHLRKDVGLSATEIDREARRFLWDVPNHWRV